VVFIKENRVVMISVTYDGDQDLVRSVFSTVLSTFVFSGTDGRTAEQEEVFQYLKKNISSLSTEEAVLGGTYYVIDITFGDNQSGTVTYEDGHVQHTATFTYVIDTQGQPSIRTFTLVQGEGATSVSLFYIDLEDGGKKGDLVGCGDSVVAVSKKIPTTTAPLRAALDALLADTRQTLEGGLYNSLYQSTLSVESIVISATGVATVKLSGQVALGGVCDDPRFAAQLKKTIEQFPTVISSNIFINGKTLESVVSQKGE
jgi:hypothetical protein